MGYFLTLIWKCLSQDYKSDPFISIVVPIKNVEAFIPGLIESLEAQTYKNFRVIVIDGLSNDNSIEKFERSSLRIKIYSENDRSLSNALKKGLDRAEGEIVAIMTKEDRYYPYTLQEIVNLYKKHPFAPVYFGDLDVISKAGDLIYKLNAQTFDHHQIKHCRVIPNIPSTFFNKKTLGEHLFYNDDYPSSPDYDLWLRLSYLFPKQSFIYTKMAVAKMIQDELSMSFTENGLISQIDSKIGYFYDFVYGHDIQLKEKEGLNVEAEIVLWCVEQLRSIGAARNTFAKLYSRAYRASPQNDRLLSLLGKEHNFFIDVLANEIKEAYSHLGSVVLKKIDCGIEVGTNPFWTSAKVIAGDGGGCQILTSDLSWGYSAQVKFNFHQDLWQLNRGCFRLWVRVKGQSELGIIGISTVANLDDIKDEIFIAGGQNFDVSFLIYDLDGAKKLRTILVRSGGVAKSILQIDCISVHCETV